MVQTIICMKWGTRYPSTYVNCLWSMIKRNTRRPTRLVCFTDDASGISPDVTTAPLPRIALPARIGDLPWRKIALWAEEVPGLSGDVLFLDLDVVITGSIGKPYCEIPAIIAVDWGGQPVTCEPIGAIL